MFWRYLRWIPIRAIICIMLFTCCWTSYMCRLQMPILAVAMIKTAKNSAQNRGSACSDEGGTEHGNIREIRSKELNLSEHTIHELKHESIKNTHFIVPRQVKDNEQDEGSQRMFHLFSGEPFEWSPDVRGLLIAAYSYGNVPGNLIGGLLALKYGPRRAILWTSLIAALLCLISPILAQAHWGVLAFARIIVGVTGGVTFPACHTMVAKWAPPEEKSRFVWSLLGGTFGTIITYPMVAAIADEINWETAWYLPSSLMFVWIFFWILLAYDSPAEHPGITEEEKTYILSSQANTVQGKQHSLKEIPVLAILTSIPFLCLILCHFGNLFLLFFYQNTMMIYLTQVLGFNITKGGVAASFPWLGRMLFGFVFSWGADLIKKKKLMTITALRKTATIFSHLMPAICLVMVGYMECSFMLANMFLFLALGFNGAATVANLSNNQDLSPNYAGFLYGIMNTVGCTAGMIIPPMVEAIAGKRGNTIAQWQIIFWIGAGVCLLGMIMFILGGSGKIQKWNDVNESEQ